FSQKRISYFFYKPIIAWSTYDFSSGITAYTMGNFDGDSYPDIAVGTLDGHISTIFDSVEVAEYQLQISTTLGGTTSPAPGTYNYAENVQATVTGIPETGYQFDHWLINNTIISTENPITLTIDADYTITAYFRTAEGVIPHDDMYINEDTVLASGFYNLEDNYEPEGIIIINASDIVLDCNYAVLNGSGWGVAIVNHGFDNVTIKNAVIQNFDYGILFYEYTENNVILDNKISQCKYDGVWFCDYYGEPVGNNITIVRNEISLCEYGIELDAVSNINVTLNNVTLCRYGAGATGYSGSLVFANNSFAYNEYGLATGGANCIIMYNTLNSNSKYGLYLSEASDSQIVGNIIVNNTQIGIYLRWNCSYNIVAGNTIIDNQLYGLLLRYGDFNEIVGNTILRNGQCGINISYVMGTQPSYYMYPSLNNTVAANTVNFNLYGIALKGEASYNTIVNNTIADNSYGIFLSIDQYEYTPYGNEIYHNNFIGNTVLQAYDEGANTFDNGYPSGGNYWSNYTGTDEFTGPYQNETGSDGIGDTPYIINIDSQDNYPLMNANSWEPFTMLAVMEKLSEFDTPNNFLNPKNVNTFSTIALIMLVGFISIKTKVSRLKMRLHKRYLTL
ncbi:MAG: NosD domain-containing protein, partial [Candidatus Bathycorpusculaceae bacterium]